MIIKITGFSDSEFNKLLRAKILAEKFFDTMLHVILDQSRFTYTTHTPEQVFNHIASNHENMSATIRPWKPFNPWTSAIATTFKNKPGEIYINVRKINQRTVAQYVASLTHEILHLAPLSYGHGSNSPKGKELSVPYFLGNKAGEWARGK